MDSTASVMQTPSQGGESLDFLLCHMLQSLGKKIISSSGDFSVIIKLLEVGFASYYNRETKFEFISPS